MVKEFFDQIKSITDILNVGRLIFYTFAGVLCVIPLFMVISLLLMDGGSAPSLFTQMRDDLRNITTATETSIIWGLAWTSLVAGFLLAVAGFPLALEDIGATAKQAMAKTDSDTYSFPRNYPFMRNAANEDYAGWLISEYFRYVEIAVYIPLGAIVGLVLLGVYVFIFFIGDFARPNSAGLTATHIMLLLILYLLVLIKYYIWPEIWVKKVVIPLVQTYYDGKRDIVDGLHAKGMYEKDRAANRAQSPG